MQATLSNPLLNVHSIHIYQGVVFMKNISTKQIIAAICIAWMNNC